MSNFITNSQTKNLKSRLINLIKESTELKFLVGFFYFSGWQEIYEALKDNKEVNLKILVGLQVDNYLSDIIEVERSKKHITADDSFKKFMNSIEKALNNSSMDNKDFFSQFDFFVKLLENNRLHIRKTENPNHAKLYLFRFNQNNFGLTSQFITGSSNLTHPGLSSQEEFNVEIRDYGYEEAEDYFESLWDEAIEITEDNSKKEILLDFLKKKTQTTQISPYEAYAYILKNYLDVQKESKLTPSVERLLENNSFKKFKYQLDAVSQALAIIDEYNGVIIADVVGLGKSVIGSLIAHQLGRRGLILCPPGLIGSSSASTGWYEYKNKFKLDGWTIESCGSVDTIAEEITNPNNPYEYDVVIVDEAHRFRNQDTAAYEALSNICRGKKVILLTATPFNNTPMDIYSLLKLFIVPGCSTITIEDDLEEQFQSFNYRFNELGKIIKNAKSSDKKKQHKANNDYKRILNVDENIDLTKVKSAIKQLSSEINHIISPVVIRRNRIDLIEDPDYSKEISTLSIIKDPIEQFYTLSPKQSEFYNKVLLSYFAEDNGIFTGAIYQPFEYETSTNEKKLNESGNRLFQQQKNLFGFMRRLLIKRFESSFGAFYKSIVRFIKVHEMVLAFIEISGKYILDRKVIESIYQVDESEAFTLNQIKETLEKFKQNSQNSNSSENDEIYIINNFHNKDQFLNDIKSDIKLFKRVKHEMDLLDLVNNDPKCTAVTKSIDKILLDSSNNKVNRKIILFSEYSDTVDHIESQLKTSKYRILYCNGNLNKNLEKQLNSNFNAQYNEEQTNNFDILITTDKLSEGFNLNRAGLIINYDIPWNPTRVIQRVGRINRIGRKVFDELYIYNFFPSEQGSNHLTIREIAEQKMFLIHNALGEDSKIFHPDEEPSAAGLFSKINKVNDDLEIDDRTIIKKEYLKIKQEHPEIIKRIEQLPDRVKTAKISNTNNVVTLRRKGFSLFPTITNYNSSKPIVEEVSFNQFLKHVKCNYEDKRLPLSERFWSLYELSIIKNKRRNRNSQLTVEQKSFNSLKSLLKFKNTSLQKEQVNFIETIINDITKYKILPKPTLRKLIFDDSLSTDSAYNKLLKNIEEIRRQVGIDYLKVVLDNVKGFETTVIIAIENISL